MFSWKKQNPPSRRQQPAPSEDYSDLVTQGMRLATADIPDDDEDMGDGDEDMGDLDLDDPELLAELQGLASGEPSAKPKAARGSTQSPSKAPAPTPTAVRRVPASTGPSTDRSSSSAAGRTAPSVDNPPAMTGLGVDVQSVLDDKDDDEEVELTEEDWNDPYLMAQLQSLGGHTEPKVQNSAAKEPAKTITETEGNTKPSQSLTSTPSTPAISPDSTPTGAPSDLPKEFKKPTSASSSMIAIPPRDKAYEDEEMSIDLSHTEPMILEKPQEKKAEPAKDTQPTKSESQPQNEKGLLELLKKRDLQYKLAAVEAKKAGNKGLALDRVKIYKTLQTWIQLVESGGFLDPELYPVPPEPAPVPPAKVSNEIADKTPPAPKVPETPVKVGVPAQETIASPSATASTEPAHHADSYTEAVEDDIRATSPKRKTVGIEFRPLAADDDFQIISNSDSDTFDMLESQLESQIKVCTSTAHYYYQNGDKQTALEFHKLNKVFKADLVSLQSHRSHGKKAPAFHFQDVRYEVEIGFFQEIGLNELSIEVIRAWDLSSKEVQASEIDAYVAWDLGWPTENMPGAGSGKGTTLTAKKSSRPEFYFGKILSVDRSRAFQRFVERRKVSFDVWHDRGFSSFFFKNYHLGRTQVPLQPLLNHSEIHEICSLVDPNNRKPTGGKLEIKIRLQRPLLKREIVLKEEKWLVIDEFNSGGLGFPSLVSTVAPSRPTGAPAAKATATANVATGKDTAAASAARPSKPATPIAPVAAAAPATPAPTRTTPTPTPASIPQPTAPKPPQKPVLAAAPVADSGAAAPAETEEEKREKALEELNSVELLVSSTVLEKETERVTQMKNEADKAGNREVSEECDDRLMQLQLKLQLLQVKVGTGQLSLEDYCKMVYARIGKDKQLAVTLKKLGLKNEAVRALLKAKAMEEEMKEIEAAQEEEE